MDLLECTIQPYAWGSRTAIAELTGRDPTDRPEAEMWMGAHPLAPSRTAGVSLLERIERAPAAELGSEVVARFGPRLPFLLKVLAAAQPLSLQAHPSPEQARAGFEDEERRGVPRDAPHRNYKDPSAKPELLCALGPFEALCGFREPHATRALFADLARLGATELEPHVVWLDGRGGEGLRTAFANILELPRDRGAALASSVLAACQRYTGKYRRECAWAARLGELYPGDVGAVTALFLDHVELQAGDAIYLDAGNLHAYLEGTAIEIMASSDNVLRGGLTPKHVDVPELLRVLSFEPAHVAPIRPTPIGPHEVAWATPALDFRLSRVDLVEGEQARPERRGPEILLCVDGSARLVRDDGAAALDLARGAAAFVRADDPGYVVEGAGSVFRATVGG